MDQDDGNTRGGGSPGPKKVSGHQTRLAPRGISTAQRKCQRQLAAQLREDMCSEFISRYWLAMAMGRDPRVELRDVDPKTGRNREGRPSSTPIPEQLPTLEQSANAMVQYILRRDGQPAKAEELEQRLGRGEAERPVLDPAVLAGMSTADLRSVVGRLRGAMNELQGERGGGVPGPSAPAVGITLAPREPELDDVPSAAAPPRPIIDI